MYENDRMDKSKPTIWSLILLFATKKQRCLLTELRTFWICCLASAISFLIELPPPDLACFLSYKYKEQTEFCLHLHFSLQFQKKKSNKKMQNLFPEDIIKAIVPYSSWSQYSILYFSDIDMHTFYYEKKIRWQWSLTYIICLNKSNKKPYQH